MSAEDVEFNPESQRAFAEKYYEWARVANYSNETIIGRKRILDGYFGWCEDRAVVKLSQVTPGLLERYQKHLYHYRNQKTGRALSVVSQHGKLAVIRSFYKWLTKKRWLAYNPAGELDLPKLPYKIPRSVLTTVETERVLAGIDLKSPTGIRNRAMLEVFYSTGLRRKELVRLKIGDVDMQRGLVLVKEGKGKKDRVVPIGERALAWLSCYLEQVRPHFTIQPDTGFIFLARQGRSLDCGHVTALTSRYVRGARLEKRGACHLFRHTMATHLLENEVDIRFIQEMLGHKKLESTEIYTHVSVRKLKEVHTAKHPAAKLKVMGAQKQAQKSHSESEG